MVAGQRQLVAAAGAGAFDCADVVLAGVDACGLVSVAGFVGEFAEIHLVAVFGAPQHADVGTGAKYVVFVGAQDDAAHLGMLKAHALNDVGQFDIDAEVVGVEFQFVASKQAAVFVDIHEDRGDIAVVFDAPVAVVGGVGAKVDQVGHGGVRGWYVLVYCGRLGRSIAQLEALDFAGGGFREVVDEFDPARVFPLADGGFDVGL